ncbi:hypothetical protein K402DRAFT_325298, partial [Aulographum hederae CBS 113979]
GPQILLEDTVRVLGLPIGLRVKSCGQARVTAYSMAKPLPKVRHKLRTTVRYDCIRKTFLSPDEVQESLDYCLSSNEVHWDKFLLFTQPVDYHHDSCEVPSVPPASWQRGDEVH